jgi:hypothetical protein
VETKASTGIDPRVLKAGAIVLAVAAAFFLWNWWQHGNDKTSCELSAVGATLIGSELAKGASPVVKAGGAIAGVAVTAGCVAVIKSWEQNPSQSTQVTLHLPDGSTTTKTLTGDIIIEPASTVPPVQATRVCSGWTVATFYDWCQAGELPERA